MTRQLFHIAAFWIAAIVAIRLAVCFPRSMLARVLFYRHGPAAVRGESRADYLMRCARFRASWFLQAVFLFAAGWLALRSQPALADSLFFVVLWAAVIPALGLGALAGVLLAAGAAWRARNQAALAR